MVASIYRTELQGLDTKKKSCNMMHINIGESHVKGAAVVGCINCRPSCQNQNKFSILENDSVADHWTGVNMFHSHFAVRI